MASSQPVVRQVKLIAVLVQFVILGFMILIFDWLGAEDPVLFGVTAYLLVSLTVRNLIPVNHRKGIRLSKSNQYEKALAEFQKSCEFFSKHRWIDKYRCIVLLSSSRVSYLEMGMLNMAFCYGQIGNGSKSREFYQKVLEEFPGSKMAEAALKMYDAAKDI